ncbi:unnamed protein product, partial [Didymodactylos carnosus]
MNEVFSDEVEGEEVLVEEVRQLKEDIHSIEGVQEDLKTLLEKSRHLQNNDIIRKIDERISNLFGPLRSRNYLKSVVLTGNDIHNIVCKRFPDELEYLELGANFISDLEPLIICGGNCIKTLQHIGVGWNEIGDIQQIFTQEKWLNLCSLDLSYNLLSDIFCVVQPLKQLLKLRILYLQGNPICLIPFYRAYIIDSFQHLSVFDDVTITAEERFRYRSFAQSITSNIQEASLTIKINNIKNVPMPVELQHPETQSEVPVKTHKYYVKISWFKTDQLSAEDDNNNDVDMPFDKFSNYHNFESDVLKTASLDWKNDLDFGPTNSEFKLTISKLIQLRDYFFHGAQCDFVYEMTEYYPPDESDSETDDKGKHRKKSPNSKRSHSSGKKKDGSDHAKGGDKKQKEQKDGKKKPADLSNLVAHSPKVITLATFHIDLKPLLEGEFTATKTFKEILKEQYEQQTNMTTQPPLGKNKKQEKAS